MTSQTSAYMIVLKTTSKMTLRDRNTVQINNYTQNKLTITSYVFLVHCIPIKPIVKSLISLFLAEDVLIQMLNN